jgi:uncharacterized protein YggE
MFMPGRRFDIVARPRVLVVWALIFGLLALLPASAWAQNAGAPTPQGLTVIGYGQASAKADSATLQLLIADPNAGIHEAVMIGPEGRVATPAPTPVVDRRAQLTPIVDAITAQGIKEDAIEVVISPTQNNHVGGPAGVAIGRIDVTMSKPTLAKLTKLFDAVQQSAAQEGLALGQIGASYAVKDCQPLNQDARKAAIEDARANAKTQADLLGIQTGPITAASDLAAGSPLTLLYGLPVSGGCTPPLPPINFGDLGLEVSIPTFDPTTEPAVTVYAQVSLTFAIAAG